MFPSEGHPTGHASVLPGISDHDAVFVESNSTPKKLRQQRRQIPLWRNTDWTKLQDHISSLWNGVSDDLKARGSPNCLWEIFCDGLEKGIQLSVPHRTASRQDRYPWISRSLKRLIKKKRRLFTRKRKKPMRQNIGKYKQVQSQVQKKFRREYWDYVSNIMFPSEGQTDGDKDNRQNGTKILHLHEALQEGFYWSGTFEGHNNRPHGDRSSKESATVKSTIPICRQSKHTSKPDPYLLPVHPTQYSFQHTWKPSSSSAAVSNLARVYYIRQRREKMLETLKPHKAAGPGQIRPLIQGNYQENGNLQMLFQFTIRDLNTYPSITGRSH